MDFTHDTARASEAAHPSAPAGCASTTYPARQPVLDAQGLLWGYELIERALPQPGDGAQESADAPARTTLDAIAAPGVHAALGGHRGYINATRALLFSDDLPRLSPDRFFVELPRSIDADAQLVARLVALHAKRHRFVLDDVTEPDATFGKLLPYADAVKVHVERVAPAFLLKLADALKSAGKILIALGVDSHETFERAKAAHFDYFQGYFFASAPQPGARRASAPRQALLNLLRLLASDPSVAQLEAELKLNPILVMHIMRLANSGEASIGRRVATLRDAINATGTNRIARWTQLLLYADGRKVRLEDDPLLQMAATRARFMEMAAVRLSHTTRKVVDGAFLTGVFSLVDAVFGGSLDSTLEALGLATHIRAAIARREGILGTLLDAIVAIERADWAALDRAADALAPLTSGELAELAIAAAAWASTAEQQGDNAGLERVDE